MLGKTGNWHNAKQNGFENKNERYSTPNAPCPTIINHPTILLNQTDRPIDCSTGLSLFHSGDQVHGAWKKGDDVDSSFNSGGGCSGEGAPVKAIGGTPQTRSRHFIRIISQVTFH